MNLLMIYPAYPDTFWSFRHVLGFISRKATFPPLGLLTVAAMLPASWNKKLVDVNVTELTDEQIAWADLVFISAMIVQKDSARRIIHRCKGLHKTVVLGGPAATSQPDVFAEADHFICNEAEITLGAFLADWDNQTPRRRYASEQRPDITQTPVPLWSLIRFKDYASMALQYSRGCPFDCEFCDITAMYGRVCRTKSPQQILAEFQSLYDAGWRGDVFVVDDNFIGNRRRVQTMLAALIAWQKQHKYPFALTTETSINLADHPRLMRQMHDANFHKVFVGIESPHDESLRECRKTQNTQRDLVQSVRAIHRQGLQVMGGFILGFDSDPDSIFEAQIQFIQRAGIVTAMVGLLNALPHTRLWSRLKAEGRLLRDSTGENTDATLNFRPRMDKERLLEGYRTVLATLYSSKHYYERIHTLIRSYTPTFRNRISLRDFMAGLKSLWHIGVRSPSRFYFWKLLGAAACRRLSTVPLAIELAIYGLHFEKTTQKVLLQAAL
ncbi:MAG: DUF4070 domain-containing protein [Sedimentisphaerales bacterium]|nr:DUF4070 domain-containing protein [Sedimentisphaerales bacterium]